MSASTSVHEAVCQTAMLPGKAMRHTVAISNTPMTPSVRGLEARNIRLVVIEISRMDGRIRSLFVCAHSSNAARKTRVTLGMDARTGNE